MIDEVLRNRPPTAPTPLGVLSREIDERLRARNAGHVYNAWCICGLYSMSARPTSKAGTYTAGCRQCQFRILTRDPRNLFGLLGLGSHLGEHALAERQDLIDRIRQMGAMPSELEIIQMPLHRGKLRKIVSNIPSIGCVCCGSRRDGQVRVDRHDKPYFHCMACNEPGIFTYTDLSTEIFCGVNRMVADGRLDPDLLAERGRQIWRSWMAHAVTGAETEAQVVHESTSEVGHG